jgi:hypothetical protein
MKLEDSRKNIDEKQLSILKSISNKIKEDWDETYIDAKYNPGPRFQGKTWTKDDQKNYRRALPKVAAS